MMTKATYIKYRETNKFSKLVYDYIDEVAFLKDYLTEFPSIHSLEAQMNLKRNQATPRQILVDTLKKQYQSLVTSSKWQDQIESLLDENTFTFCTAHQPLIFTGHLYFIYKIIDIIQLSKEAKATYPHCHFVPVFYVGSEDHDLEEIGSLHFNHQTYKWTTDQKGACGRMRTEELKWMVSELNSTLNASIPDEAELMNIFNEAYDGKKTLMEATRFLLHALFENEGLIILDADDIALKRTFSSVMRHELLNQDAQNIVKIASSELGKNYQLQANPRAINLFYLLDQLRERIEVVNDRWVVLNTDISFNETELLLELETYPDRFSPNVILRPLYQETILPNIMVVGGGGELAYWLELKKLFEYHQVVFPQIILRSSVLWVDDRSKSLMAKLPCSFQQLFLDKDILFKQLIRHDSRLMELQLHLEALNKEYDLIKDLGQTISSSLEKSMQAHHAKAKRIELRIKQKFEADIKRQDQLLVKRIEKLMTALFPNGQLQERHDNFISIFKNYGKQMFNILSEHQRPLKKEFLILSPE